MSHIFISYSKKNRDYARPLADHLLSLGFDVWIDDEIQPSEDWWRNIRAAIRDCAAFILVMTPEAENSHWVGLELLHGLEYKKPFFPLLLAGSPNLLESDSWSRIASIQFTDVRNRSFPPERFYDGLTRRGVPRKLLPGKNLTPPVALAQPRIFGGEIEVDILLELKKVVLSFLPPPFDWCIIPDGKTTIEYSDTDHKTFDVPSFLMAKYPITNAQYQVFVNSRDGYDVSHWWDYSDHAQSWREDNPKPVDSAFPGEDIPRTMVSWYDSVAFTRWFSSRFFYAQSHRRFLSLWDKRDEKNIIAIPTEQQWRRAAQGNDSRAYPWGDTFNMTLCNTSESGIAKPTPVTQYPLGISPYDVFDMSGNVWEWSLSSWRDDSISLGGHSRRSLRGGSWKNDAYGASCNYRSRGNQNAVSDAIGFRVVVSRPPSR